MAETAPLTAAHAHARTAAEETRNIHWNEAANEHENAASNFARAARATSDSEALRVLGLLEEQHLKLARIIKSQDASEPADHGTSEAKQADPAILQRDFALETPPKSTPSEQTKSSPSALAAARLGSQVRDSSPSLARDIASRRGIPQPGRNPPSAAAQARARQLSPESHRRSRATPAPKIPPSVMDSQNLQPASKAKKAEDDDAFAKFYNNLTTGTMSKLSSALAFAGLPINAEDVQAEQNRQKLNKRTVSANNEPDVKKIFSKAALDAIEDEHRKRGSQGHVFGPAESFYVVQKGGGTYSYADIVKPQQQHLSGIDEDDDDAFVDAREAQAPPSPRHSRSSAQGRGSFGKSRTHEELELENTTLKTTLEQLATRLADFETHAQDASMAALTQSMISQGGGPIATPTSDAAALERIRQLERQLEQTTEERQTYENLAAKHEKSAKQLKSKWEGVMKSAKEKERVKREKGKAAEEASNNTAGPS